MHNIQLKNGLLIDPGQQFEAKADVFISQGKIAAIGQIPAGFVIEQSIDAAGCIICPGLIDLSARLGQLESELKAAVAGGITALACPPDAKPTLDEPDLVERLVRHSASLGLARVFPIGALTQQLAGEKLAAMHSLAQAGCIAFSQAKKPIFDTQILLRAMQYAASFDYAVRLHPQDHYLTKDGVAHDGLTASKLGLAGIPVCAETVSIATALQLAQETGVRLHLARLSSAAGIELVRAAQQNGLKVSCDVAIHHLHLCDADIGYFDTRARFEPPLRAASDQAALRQAAASGLAAICSDHTPVDADGKELPFAEALPGASAFELLLPLTLRWAAEDKIPLAKALARITSDPAKILGIQPPALKPGQSADLCVFDPQQIWRVTPEALRSQGKNTPFMGHDMQGKVRATIINGRLVFAQTPD